MHIDYHTLSGPVLYALSFLIVLGESGVFFLFFLPGDSLLFAVGLLAASGAIAVGHVIPLLIVAAILGNFLGYYLGTFTRDGLQTGRYLPKVKADHLHKAELFYAKYGAPAILFARFVPIVRTLVPFVGGIVRMKRRVFSLWSIVGAIAWVTVVTLIGYFFGHVFHIGHVAYLGVGVVMVVVVATPVCMALLNRFVKRL